MKLATWNVNSLGVRLPQLLDWLAAQQPDVVVLQETKLTDDKFPQAEIEAAGWHSLWFGQKTYNGVALLSRSEASDVVRNIPGFDDPQARVIAATVDGVRVVGAYFPNGQAPGSDKFAYKMAWLDALRAWLRTELANHPRLVLMGDYNVAPEDRDVDSTCGCWPARSTAQTKNGRTFRVCWGWGWSMPFGCSSRRRASGAGGTTATWPFAKTRACASITSLSARPCSLRSAPARWTSCREKTNGPATTRQFGLS